MTKRETIIQRVLALLGTLTSVPAANVYRSRVQAFSKSESPALHLQWIQDSPNQTTHATIDWSLTMKISVLIRGSVPDAIADAVVAEIYHKLMADPTLDGLVIGLDPGNSDFQIFEADNDAGVIGLEFVAVYRTQLTDLTT